MNSVFSGQKNVRYSLARAASVRYMHTECIFYAGLKHLSLSFQLGSLDKGGALLPMHLVES